MTDFTRLIDPRGVAIVGASADPARIGGQPVRANREFGYTGHVYPVNPKYAEIGGLPCYPDLRTVPQPCDVAVIAVPAKDVPAAIDGCGAAGIPFAVVLSAGFAEIGARGAALDAALREAVARSGVRLIGPNCQGLLNFRTKFYGGFGSIFQNRDLRAGTIAMVTQSGGFGYAVIGLAEAAGIGFHVAISTGNELDVDSLELIAYLLERDDVSMVATYLEGVNDGRRLIALGARALELGKPIVVWKVGNTSTGRRAAASHTGNLTGEYDLYRAAFASGGFIEVQDVDDLIDVARAVAAGRFPAGDRVAVISISGGAGVVSADRLDAYGLTLPALQDSSIAQLREIVPAFSSLANPIDVTAQIFNSLDIFARAVDVVRSDPNVDQLVIYNASVQGAAARRIAEALAPVVAASTKPMLVAWSAPPGRADDAMDLLRDGGVPLYPTPGRAAFAASALATFARAQRRAARPASAPALASGTVVGPLPPQRTLTEWAAREVLAPYGIPFASAVAIPREQIDALTALPFAFPVVVKADAPALAHKTEAGGVRVGLGSIDEVRRAAHDVIAAVAAAAPRTPVDGVIVAEQVSGIEMIAGAFVDRVFGPVVVCGFGGIFAEVLGDHSRRFAPFDAREAEEMLAELRGAAILRGARTGRPYDVAAFARMLAALSRFAAAHAERLEELDLNPVFVREQGRGAVAADALVILRAAHAASVEETLEVAR